jgi:gliding motility-associated-like protein
MKKLLVSCIFLLIQTALMANADTYLKSLGQIDNSQSIRVLPAKDLGWLMFSLDSLKAYKFNNCGQLEWSLKYSLPGDIQKGTDIIATTSGGFAFLTIASGSSGYYSTLVNVAEDGSVFWCKSLLDNNYTEVPYSLLQDNSGNFYVYSNVTLTQNLDVFNSLTKISSSGNVLWNKLYNHGGIWGGAILTKDNGFLLRTGSTFIKTDINGNVVWSTFFSINTHRFYKAIEVDDGYIFNGYVSDAGGGDTVAFFKISKNGAMQWGGEKHLNFSGSTKPLLSKYNGNLLFIHDKLLGGNYYSTWTEFDKDLNVLSNGAVLTGDANSSFDLKSMCFLSDSSSILVGKYTTNDPALVPHLGFIKADKNQHYTCDTSFSISSHTIPTLQNFFSTLVTYRTFTTSDKFIVVQNFSDTTYTHCSNFSPLSLNLGNDTLLCEGSMLTLKNKTNDSYTRFLWSNGATSPEITVTQSGKYWLRAINSCRPDSISDTLTVSFNLFPQPPLLKDTSICSNNPIVLDATILNGTYLWQDGSSAAVYPVYEPGQYRVKIDYLNCTKVFETNVGDCEILLMPNVITPNNDASNNAFLPIEIRGINEASLKIFNRWGKEIYYTSDIINRPWTGNAYDKKCSDGVYYWIVNYTNYLNQVKIQKGCVALFSE